MLGVELLLPSELINKYSYKKFIEHYTHSKTISKYSKINNRMYE